MIAFVTFIRTFAIWIYLLCALGILFGIKMLFDARSLSRTTLFSLDQERAVAMTSRGLLVIVVMAVIIFFVTFVSVIVAPFMPQPESPIVRGVTPTLANIFPTSAPTLTPSLTVIKPTETAFATSTPVPVSAWTFTPSSSVPITTVRPTTLAGPTSNLLPSPVLDSKGPVYNNVSVNNENAMNTSLRFQWTWNCTGCVLGPNDKFVVVVTFVDRKTGLPKIAGGSTQNNYLTLGEILRSYGDVGQFYQKAVDDKYQWNVQVKRSLNEQPISAQSDPWIFYWR